MLNSELIDYFSVKVVAVVVVFVVVGGCFLEFEYDGIAGDMGGRFEAFAEGVGVAV